MSMSKKDFQRLAEPFRLSLRAIENMDDAGRRDAALQKHEDLLSGVITSCYEGNIHFSRQKFEEWVLEYKYIAYVQRDMPGDRSFDLHRFRKDSEVLEYLRELEDATGDQWYASLYPYSTEGWRYAKDFETTGCPFDYPWKVSERGPRGGLKLVTA